jgi:Ca-activated chloride channel family protein
MALARPMLPGDTLEKREGIAVVIVVDTSSTMLARDLDLDLTDMAFLSRRREDFKDITRLDASLLVAENFIKKRDDDLIGLVAFAASAYVVSPLTFDHEWLLRSLERIKIGMIKDGTAIGSGILSALNALKDVDAKSRVVILMTDGINNYGQISPVTAAKAARAVGVRVYTIGITSDGPVNIKSTDELGREREEKVLIKINEDRLRKISDITGGEYFRVKGVGGLRESYEKIDRLEKVEIIEKGYEKYVDIFQYFAFPGFLFFLAGVVLDNTFFRKIP